MNARTYMTLRLTDVSFNFYPIKNPKTDAVSNVSLLTNKFIIRGFSIRKSKTSDDLYVSPPHKKLNGGGWAKLFWTDKETWKELEQLIIKEFKNR